MESGGGSELESGKAPRCPPSSSSSTGETWRVVILGTYEKAENVSKDVSIAVLVLVLHIGGIFVIQAK